MDDGERRSALTKFASEGRRAQPPVFVGRDAVIEDISKAAELAYDKWSSGGIDAKDPGLTRLVQGAPGAGKTAMLRHLQERWRGDPGPGRPISVRVSASALESPAEMHKGLREQIPTTVMEKWGGGFWSMAWSKWCLAEARTPSDQRRRRPPGRSAKRCEILFKTNCASSRNSHPTAKNAALRRDPPVKQSSPLV